MNLDKYYLLREKAIEVALNISKFIARGDCKMAESNVTYLSAIIRQLKNVIDNDKTNHDSKK